VPEGFAQMLLGIITVATGGSLVQLVIFLIKRRATLSALDTEATAPLLEQQGALVDRLAAAELKALKRVESLEEQQRARDQEFTATMEISNRERARLNSEVASLRTEVDIARRQIADLTDQLRSMSRPRRGVGDDIG
jgi:chromosome segregation ATPase